MTKFTHDRTRECMPERICPFDVRIEYCLMDGACLQLRANMFSCGLKPAIQRNRQYSTVVPLSDRRARCMEESEIGLARDWMADWIWEWVAERLSDNVRVSIEWACERVAFVVTCVCVCGGVGGIFMWVTEWLRECRTVCRSQVAWGLNRQQAVLAITG